MEENECILLSALRSRNQIRHVVERMDLSRLQRHAEIGPVRDLRMHEMADRVASDRSAGRRSFAPDRFASDGNQSTFQIAAAALSDVLRVETAAAGSAAFVEMPVQQRQSPRSSARSGRRTRTNRDDAQKNLSFDQNEEKISERIERSNWID